jgi:hypothetical protein
MIGENEVRLDGSLLRITEIFFPDSANKSMRAIYDRIHGYIHAKFVES